MVFDLTKGLKSETRAIKLDALRLKKYYGYFIKQNRTKPLDWLVENAMAPLNHMFDDHSLCCDSWCLKKRLASKNNDVTTASIKSQCLEEGYYRTLQDNLALYEAIKTRYQRYISREFLAQCRHEFDTNLNEDMNQSVATYASKGLTFCSTPSLRARVLTAAGIQLVGYHRFWTSIFSRSNLPIKKQFSDALIGEDKRKVRKYYREHSNDYKAKRNKAFHDRFRNEIKAQQEDKKRNAIYLSRSGCESHGNNNLCGNKGYGCGGEKGHKSVASRYCLYHKAKGAELERMSET
jgi:hypothetical protein